jgi:hypothetical protein
MVANGNPQKGPTMEQPMFEGSNARDLAGAGATLAENEAVRKLLEQRFGKDRLGMTMELLRTGQLEEGLGAEIHDLLSDEIVNEAETVWEGMLGDDPEGFSVRVMSWGGVFFVSTPEYDDVGYFFNVEDAVEYIEANWDDVRKM